VNWTELHGRTARARVPLPTYAFDRKRYWLENESRPAIRSGDEAPVSKTEVRVQTVAAENEGRNASDVTAKLGAIFKEALGVAHVGLTDRFFDLGGDSLAALDVMAQIELAFGQRLPVTSLIKGQTVASLAEMLCAARGRNAQDLVVPIRASGLQAALFCPHPYGGQVMSYLPLSRMMDDHPVFGLRARGLEGESAPHSDIPAIASEHIEAMKTVQSVGPYHLAGFSMGGTIAWEMACQLRDAGEQVDFLALLDSAAEHEPRSASAVSVHCLFGHQVPAWLSSDSELLTSLFPPLLDLWPMLAQQPVGLQFAALRGIGVDRGLIPAVDEGQIRQMIAVARANGDALRRYRPRSY